MQRWYCSESVWLHSTAGHVGKHLTNICILRSKLSLQYSVTKYIFKVIYPALLQCNLPWNKTVLLIVIKQKYFFVRFFFFCLFGFFYIAEVCLISPQTIISLHVSFTLGTKQLTEMCPMFQLETPRYSFANSERCLIFSLWLKPQIKVSVECSMQSPHFLATWEEVHCEILLDHSAVTFA